MVTTIHGFEGAIVHIYVGGKRVLIEDKNNSLNAVLVKDINSIKEHHAEETKAIENL